ncbi:hypothetical protein [Nonomuraea sp. NEAU-A123]|uniref:hypothetical protein n=1 Tax=Nonomuraea sp. NEAU-A123 TaxID=2839649 RepID=UPI001BE459C9|nr:hypothetical protein [Nonomuraea sp. NEAU-A123]MBT2232755.1 hypothetical protein [Nonomuraea sp. NEAU-A123]
MWIALAAAVVIGVAVWWFRRDAADGGPAAERRPGWEARLGDEGATALLEGLRAFADAGTPVDLGGESGVLTVFEPPRLISLDLLADRFAARGQAAMHDPQTTVGELMAEFLAAEEPGVLHLRAGWADGGRFADEVREIVCPQGAAGIGAWSDAGGLGALEVAVLGDGLPGTTMLLDLARIRDQYDESRARQPGAPGEVVLRSLLTSVIANGGAGLTWTVPPTERQLGIALAAAGPPELRRPSSVKEVADR